MITLIKSIFVVDCFLFFSVWLISFWNICPIIGTLYNAVIKITIEMSINRCRLTCHTFTWFAYYFYNEIKILKWWFCSISWNNVIWAKDDFICSIYWRFNVFWKISLAIKWIRYYVDITWLIFQHMIAVMK